MLDGDKRKAMANQLTTVSRLRMRSRMGQLSPADMNAVAAAIRVQLAL